MADAANQNVIDPNAAGAIPVAQNVNPVPPVVQNLIAPAMNEFHIIQNLPKYNGDYSAEDWLNEFEYERGVNNLDQAWAIRNLHRILEGTPKTWWLSQKPAYLRRLVRPGANAVDIWNEIGLALRGFFSARNIKEKAKTENFSIKFNIGQDPMEYVAKKIDCLNRMDPEMEIEDKVKNLLLGLPDNLRALVSPANMNSIDEFFRQLSRQLSVNKKLLTKTSRSDKDESFSFRAMKAKSNSHANYQNNNRRRLSRIPGIRVPKYDEEHRRQCIDNEGEKLCWHCKKPGHFVFTCFKLAQEQGIEIPSNVRSNNNNRRDSVRSVEQAEN